MELNNIDNNMVLIIPNNIKQEVLEYLNKQKHFFNIKLMSFNDIKKSIYFDYDEVTEANIDDLLENTYELYDVRNVTSFGAFVDIGLHDDGLVHISKMSKQFVSNPLDIVKVGDIVTVYVCGIDKEKEKVQLSLVKDF